MAAGIGRVQVWVDCACGTDIEVEADTFDNQDLTCPECGRGLRRFVSIDVDVVSPPTEDEDDTQDDEEDD